MAAIEPTSTTVLHRHTSTSPSEHQKGNGLSKSGVVAPDVQSDDLQQWRRHVEQVKTGVLEEVQDQLSGLLDRAIAESVESFSKRSTSPVDGKASKNAVRTHKPENGKVFIPRPSLLDELFEISHIRTIYHMFVAALLLFVVSTMAVDFIDQGRLVPEFELFFYAFGQLPVVVSSWLLMFGYTLLGPYFALSVWGELYHSSSGWRMPVSLGAALLLGATHIAILLLFPIYVILHYQLPPASRFTIAVEQIRFLMKSYSFIRETVPSVMQNKPKEGFPPKIPTLFSYLYFLFAPTLIYRESYPRTPYIRWNYIGFNLLKIMGSIFFLNFALVRLCIPVFTNENKPFTTKSAVLTVFHATFPGMLIMLLGFYAFLHCWLNTFAELLRFADRMFYKDWWNSTSFANYYRTWNVVVHDWLYYYGYRDFLLLSKRKFRSAAMLSVFAISAVVHEYALTMFFGFFYPVMFCTFAVIGAVFNFAINDKRKSNFWNIMMWASLMLGQGVHVYFYSKEWYAQIRCPRSGASFWELVTPRSWICDK